jgi:hypothetical protein
MRVLQENPSLALRLARLGYNMKPNLSTRIVLIKSLAAAGDIDGALEHIGIALETDTANESLRQLRNQLLKRRRNHR